MRKIVMTSLAVIAFSSPVMAQDEGFWDDTGQFAGDYLCVTEHAGGVAFDEGLGDWRSTVFNVDGERFTARITHEGYHWRNIRDERYDIASYRVQFSRDGVTFNCRYERSDVIIVGRNGFSVCNATGYSELRLDLQNLNFMLIDRGGFVTMEGETRDVSPNIQIGTCSRF